MKIIIAKKIKKVEKIKKIEKIEKVIVRITLRALEYGYKK